MTGNERARHDWFDQELDRLLIGLPDPIEGDDELVQAAVQMQRLDLNQQPEPDDRFIRNLEKQLMPNVSYLTVARGATLQNPIRTIYKHLVSRITIERTQHRRTSRLASAFSIALLFAVIAATAFVAINNGDNGEGGSRGATAPAAFTNDDATPSSDQVAGIKWQVHPPVDESAGSAGIAAANSTVYRLINAPSFTGVWALRASDGSTLWQAPADWIPTELTGVKGFTWNPIIAADDKGVYLTVKTSDGQIQLLCLDPADGRQRWTTSLPYGATSIVAQADSIATLSDESFLQAGLVFVQSPTGQITAIDPTLGTTVWQTRISPTPPESERVNDTAVVSGNMLIAKTARGVISGLYRINGNVQWSIDVAPGAELAAINGVAVIVQPTAQGHDTTTVTGIELATGKSLWTVEYTGALSQPIAGYDGGSSSIAMIADSADPAVIDDKTPRTTATPEIQPDSSNGDDERGAIVIIDPVSGLPRFTTPSIPDGVMSLFLRVPDQGLFTILTNDGSVAVMMPTNDPAIPFELQYVGAANLPVDPDVTVGMVGRAPVANRSGVFIGLGDGSIIALDDSGALSLRG